jgi:nucleoid DNA-binding protein
LKIAPSLCIYYIDLTFNTVSAEAGNGTYTAGTIVRISAVSGLEWKGGAVDQKKLTKAEIVVNVHEKVDDLTKKKIYNILDFILKEIKKGIKEDKIVELRGFGTFEIKLRRAKRQVRNPKTGDIYPGEHHGIVVFRPGQELKEIAWPMRE